jgi:phosphatidylglycerophosphatase C
MSGQVVVAFDFDGTLTRTDSVIPFIRSVAGTPQFAFGMLIRGLRVVPALLRRDRDHVRAIATEVAFNGVHADVIGRRADELARTIVDSGLRPDTVARLRWHVAEGHRVVIVSASYEQYVQSVAAQLGAHGVVATRLEVDGAGVCSGRLLGANCRGAEKVRRLEQWLAESGTRRADVVLWAYGDSAGDRELLASADHPVWVREPLASVAATV